MVKVLKVSGAVDVAGVPERGGAPSLASLARPPARAEQRPHRPVVATAEDLADHVVQGRHITKGAVGPQHLSGDARRIPPQSIKPADLHDSFQLGSEHVARGCIHAWHLNPGFQVSQAEVAEGCIHASHLSPDFRISQEQVVGDVKIEEGAIWSKHLQPSVAVKTLQADEVCAKRVDVDTLEVGTKANIADVTADLVEAKQAKVSDLSVSNVAKVQKAEVTDAAADALTVAGGVRVTKQVEAHSALIRDGLTVQKQVEAKQVKAESLVVANVRATAEVKAATVFVEQGAVVQGLRGLRVAEKAIAREVEARGLTVAGDTSTRRLSVTAFSTLGTANATSMAVSSDLRVHGPINAASVNTTTSLNPVAEVTARTSDIVSMKCETLRTTQDLTVDGTVRGREFISVSDERAKTNLRSIEIPHLLAQLQAVQCLTFDWTSDGKPSVGVSAQQLRKMAPDVARLCVRDQGELLAVDYRALGVLTLLGLQQLISER